MDVSIVIVNWNTRDLLRNCINSIIRESQAITSEIFVVDNASSDGSSEMIRAEFPGVKLIANTENRGFAAANNQGIRAATGRYVLLLNPDTVVLDSAITRCVQYADSHPDIGVVGCQVFEDVGRIQRTGFSFPTPWTLFLIQSGLSRAFPRSRVFGKPELGWWDRDTELDLDVVSGMFMLVRQSALKQVGLLDEDYFLYWEETDWCFRFARAGWRRVFTPCARIMHLEGGGKSSGQVRPKMFVQFQKSGIIYFRKNLGFLPAQAARAIYVVSNAIRALAWWCSSSVNGDRTLRQRSSAAVAAIKFHLFGIEPT